jgi:hypothetical protein
MLTNNSVEALVGDDVVKVRCRTCNYSHDYKHGQLPEKTKPRRTSQKAAYEAVLESVVAGKNPAVTEPQESASQQPTQRPRREATHHGLFTLSAARRKKFPNKQ